ncbi:hypothetical protein V8E55_008590 [Tylopilus felleus]
MSSLGFQSFSQLNRISTLFYISFGAGLLGDLLVATTMCHYLFTSRMGFRSKDTLVKTLIAYTVTTGFLTSIHAILALAFYVTMPTTFICIGLYFSLARMYINAYLALLNTRQQQYRGKRDSVISFLFSRFSDQHCHPEFGTTRQFPTGVDKMIPLDIEVHVQTTVDHASEPASSGRGHPY